MFSKPTIGNIQDMLYESNAIEGVYDQESLDDALTAWDYLVDEYDDLTPLAIREVHQLLMKRQKLESKSKGDWRRIPVFAGTEYRADSYEIINLRILDMCQMIRTDTLSPIAAHYMFEKIHPFLDGNGRTGRIIMNWQMVKQHNVIATFSEAKKDDYYKLFETNGSERRIKDYETMILAYKDTMNV